MKHQIYILVIVALSASSLYSQEQIQSTLYHLDGREYQGKVIEFGNRFVAFEIVDSNGELLTSKLPYKFIIKIIGTDGTILYENPKSGTVVSKLEIESIKKRLRKSKKMKLRTLDGESYRGNLMYIADSSLVMCKEEGCYHWEVTRNLRKEFRFTEIKDIEIKGESKIIRGMLQAFAIGALLGAFGEKADGSFNGDGILFSGMLFSIVYGGAMKIAQITGGKNHIKISGKFRRFTNASYGLIPKAIYPAGLPNAD